MMAQTHSPTSIMFKVQRGRPQLVTPAKPTPYEFKPLSYLDNLDWFKVQLPLLMFYPHNPSMNGVDPAQLIRSAIAETLVFYYPLAGRLREDPTTRKLTVECSGEGVLFIEADADVTLDQFDYPLVPPFSCLDDLLYDQPGLIDILNCHLVLIQVTRLKCGGFIFGIRMNHTIYDGVGVVQFLHALGEMARGATSPSVFPVWERHVVLNCRSPQQFISSFADPENNNDISNSITNNLLTFPLEQDLCYKAFIFGPTEISTLRGCLPPHLRGCSSFEIVTASIWKCRVAALQPHPTEEVSLIWAVNLRGNKLNHFIPYGYYGNASVLSISTSTTKEILENPLCYTLQVLRNAKRKVVTEDYDGSTMNLMASMKNFSVSDLRYAGFEDGDFGWGKAIYGGPAICRMNSGWYYPMPSKRRREKLNGIMFPFCLPKQAMERFEMELNNMLKEQPYCGGHDNAIISKL